MTIGDADFRERMAAVYDRRERNAAATDARSEALLHKLSADEAAAMALTLGDAVVVESMRVIAWREAGATNSIPPNWPNDMTAEQLWRLNMLQTKTPREIEAENRMWNEPWRLRARAQDAVDMSLRERLAEIERKEEELEQRLARDAELRKPPTPAEAEVLDTARTVAWFKNILGRDDLGDLVGIDDETFKTALREVPAQGWPDGKDDAAHLIALRADEPAPVIVPEPEPDNTGLHRLLGKA